MPEEQDAVRASEESRPVNHICLSTFDGLDKLVEVVRVVFEVGVLNDHDPAPRLLEAAAEGGAFALVPFLKENPDIVSA